MSYTLETSSGRSESNKGIVGNCSVCSIANEGSCAVFSCSTC